MAHSNRQRLAGKLLRRRFEMMRTTPLRRDYFGMQLASLVAVVRLIPPALWDGKYGKPTEVELRAVRNSRRQLKKRLETRAGTISAGKE